MAKRSTNIDLIRNIATILIVLAHIATTVYERPDFVGGMSWWVAFITITIGRMGVPLFFLISGYLLVQKNRTLSQNIQHTFWRILFPCLVWTAITYTVQYMSGVHAITLSSELLWVSGGTPYYFLIGLCVLYLINPILQKMMTAIDRREAQLLLIVLLISTIGQTVFAFLRGRAEFSVFSYWMMALCYFLYGQYTSIWKQKNTHNWTYLGVAGISLLVTTIIVYTIRSAGITSQTVWESYFGPTIVMSSICTYMWLMNLNANKWKLKTKKILESMAQACFGVYLSHSIILDVLLHKTPINPYAGTKISLFGFLLVSSIATLSLSFGLSFLLERLSWGRLIIGQVKSKNNQVITV